MLAKAASKLPTLKSEPNQILSLNTAPSMTVQIQLSLSHEVHTNNCTECYGVISSLIHVNYICCTVNQLV